MLPAIPAGFESVVGFWLRAGLGLDLAGVALIVAAAWSVAPFI
ncbi:MAG TPA: hypothetical protein VM055_06815 [Novosphingobium sp.]|nr:hypothetical protein [Novosphingobium sp.]